MPSHMIGFIPPEIGVPWHLGLHSSHHADNNAEVRGNHEFQASDDNAEVRGNHEFQASDNNAEVKAIMNSKHETSENTELRGDPSITH
jgi:hypothetical protein